MSLPFKLCPECGAEHVQTAQVCVDCDVALVSGPLETAVSLPSAPLPPASELAQIAAGSPWEMQRFALQLQEAGISCRVDERPGEPARARRGANAAPRGSFGSAVRLGLYVLPADVEAARSALQGFLLQHDAGDSAPTPEGPALEACPACGTPISAAASACADCGLEFVALEELCAFCGAVAGAGTCPSCGAEPPRGSA
jgi:hypothetical protein